MMDYEFRFMWNERVGAAVMAQSGYGWHIAESTTGVANAQRPRPSLSLRDVPPESPMSQGTLETCRHGMSVVGFRFPAGLCDG